MPQRLPIATLRFHSSTKAQAHRQKSSVASAFVRFLHSLAKTQASSSGSNRYQSFHPFRDVPVTSRDASENDLQIPSQLPGTSKNSPFSGVVDLESG